MIRIAVILGSIRPGRRGAAVAGWVAEAAARHPAFAAGAAGVELIDLAEVGLPLLAEPLPAMSGRYQHASTQRWARTVGSFDGFVFVTPEYNHSVPGALKNAIDHLYAEWNDKPAGFVSYGVDGGARAAEHLRQILGELKVADVRTQVALSVHTDFVITDPTEPGQFVPAARHEPKLHTMLDELLAWEPGLRAVRAPATATA